MTDERQQSETHLKRGLISSNGLKGITKSARREQFSHNEALKDYIKAPFGLVFASKKNVFFFFFLGPAPLALFMSYEQCIKANE